MGDFIVTYKFCQREQPKKKLAFKVGLELVAKYSVCVFVKLGVFFQKYEQQTLPWSRFYVFLEAKSKLNLWTKPEKSGLSESCEKQFFIFIAEKFYEGLCHRSAAKRTSKLLDKQISKKVSPLFPMKTLHSRYFHSLYYKIFTVKWKTKLNCVKV